jgi:site-specific recombinase XerD
MNAAGCGIRAGGSAGNAELAGRFLEQLGHLGRSPKTVKARRNGLRKLLVFLGAKRLRDVSASDLEAYRLTLVGEDLSGHTIEQYLRSARLFFGWLEQQSLLFLDPASSLVIAKPSRRVRWVLSEAQVRTLLAQPDPSRAEGLRDRALLEVAYATAVRRGELAAMDVCDIDRKQALVRVRGKGSRDRMLPLGRNALRQLALYFEHGRPRLLKDSIDCPALWVARRTRGRIADDGIGQLLGRLGEQAGLPRPLTCHVLRRSCATQMLRNGAHPEAVRMLLGHSTLGTLAQYLAVTVADIRRMHSQSNPGK